MKRDDFTLTLDLGHELIIDNFAGGGGTSTGLEAAFGRPVDLAINHDPQALAMHALNHPFTRHLCESVWDVNPIHATGNRPVGLVWLSPDCKHFSKAKGGTPVAKHIRGLAWVGMRWLALTKPRVMMLENVEEFQDWGPLLIDADGNAKPDPAKKGKTFESFIRQIKAQGYAVEWRELRACDNGAPTIRKRLFIQARRDGIPITWPAQTHGNPVSAEVIAGKLLPWRTAAECIDFSHPAASIFDRKRPLVHNTQRRVAKGLWKHVLTSGKPFIVGVGGRMGQSPERSVDQPVQTITSKADSCVAQPVLTPFLVGQGGPSYSGKPVSVDAPVGTIPTTNHRAVAQPVLAPFIADQSRPAEGRSAPADEPLRTVCAQVKGGHFNVIAPTLVPLRGTSEAHLGGHDIEAPLSTVSAGGTAALAAVHLTHLTHHGDRPGQTPDAPLPTITAAHRGEQVLVAACLEQANGGFYDGDGRAADAPMSTITSTGSNQRLVMAYYVKYYSCGGQDGALNSPMHTVPTKGRMGLVECQQVPIDCLAPEHRARAKQCAELLREHLPEHFPEPADMVLVWHKGQYWVLVDITLRMLKPPELFQAQSFPKTYIIHEIPDPKLLFVNGKQVPGDPRLTPRIPLSATDQVRMCGNSVAPKQAEALARRTFAHEARIRRRHAA